MNDIEHANAQVDAFFGQFITSDTPGAVVLVINQGQIIHRTAYGLADLQNNTPMTVHHALHLASTSKQMTAISIMMLAMQRLIDYDATLNTYIPELTNVAGICTIRQMLQHTSGLPDYDDGITELLLAHTNTPTNDDMVTIINRAPALVSPPGSVYAYSNVGYDLLAVVVERVAKQSFPDFLQSHIFTPLGMQHTFSLPNPERRAHDLLAFSYIGSHTKPELYESDILDAIYGSGSVYATVDDMALFDAALYDERLIPQSIYQEALRPAILSDGSTAPYGFGLELGEWNAESYVAHSGSWLGFNSDYVRFPQRRFSAIVLLNRAYDYPDTPRIGIQVAALYLDQRTR